MVKGMVKGKFEKKQLTLPALAIITFSLSWAGAFPAAFVENWYSRRIYPWISTVTAMFADAFWFSWLDLVIPIGLTVLVVAVHFRRFYLVANGVAILYLLFF